MKTHLNLMLAILDKTDGIRPLGKILRAVNGDHDRQEAAILKLLDYDLIEIKNLEQVLVKPLETEDASRLATGRMAL